MGKFFYCASCQLERPLNQLGKTIKGNHSKRCVSCCTKADAQRVLIARGAAA